MQIAMLTRVSRFSDRIQFTSWKYIVSTQLLPRNTYLGILVYLCKNVVLNSTVKYVCSAALSVHKRIAAYYSIYDLFFDESTYAPTVYNSRMLMNQPMPPPCPTAMLLHK